MVAPMLEAGAVWAPTDKKLTDDLGIFIKLFNNLYIDNSIENKYQLLLKYVEDLNRLIYFEL